MSLSVRDWFRIAVSRGGQRQAVGRRFFPKMSKDRSLRLRSWKKGSPLPIPPSKRVRRFDAMPPTSPGHTFCPVCKEDLGSVTALGAHYKSFHAIRDNRLVTNPSFQCSQCELVFHSKWQLRTILVHLVTSSCLLGSGELCALAEAFLWLRDESVDDKAGSVTLVYNSEVAKGLVTEPWAPQSHLRLVSLLRDLYVEACDSRLITWAHVRSHGGETDPAKQRLLPLYERADRLAERGRSGEPCFDSFVLQRWVYTIEADEPELSVERCRWCRRSFSTLGAASIHEARCRLKVGEKPGFECRKCGMRLPRRFGRAKRMAHEQYCLGSAVANLTCRNCGELFARMQARRLHETFCANIRAEAEGFVIGLGIVGSKLGYLTPLLAGTGRLLSTNSKYSTRTVGVVVLSS